SAESFAAKENFGVTLAEAMKSVKFWALNLSSILLFIMINGLMMNVAPHLRNIGYSITYSANVVALIMATLAVGKVALGKLFDSIGIKWTTMIACLSSLLAIVGLIFAEYTWALLVVIIFAGLGSAYATIANSVLTVELFGKKDYNAILGFLSAIAAIGSVVGPIITGVLYDASGNYYSSYQVLIVFGLIATLLYWIIFTKKDSDIEQPIA
ncbi:MAG: MFS transporter, partial [Clostridium sp.]|nr:MFS transporter [Clostridium sp.]